jgi:hypothetical protein
MNTYEWAAARNLDYIDVNLAVESMQVQNIVHTRPTTVHIIDSGVRIKKIQAYIVYRKVE